ncbi:MAG: PfkB family carbohydrate kinase [Clostridia bacterium]|nr:PfkB family carbohydrate kinase [Clostridia bacterium]
MKDNANGSKLISPGAFLKKREYFRQESKKVIHCHGVFDLLHPGHIAHLEEAKSLGDILVVSITSEPYVNKGPGRPYFSDELRTKSLAALECVDYVILSETTTALEIIEFIQPDLYVKGKEYENFANDITQNIDREVNKVKSYGGEVYFTDGITFSSTKLINNIFPVFSPEIKEYAKVMSKGCSLEVIKSILNDLNDLNVLVVGDIIIDEYVFCTLQGLTSKDRAISAKYLREERYLGGALAIARHLSGFIKSVTVCSIVGDESHIHTQILNDLSKDMLLDLQFDSRCRTTIKRRFIEKYGIRNEYNKIFSVNYLMGEEHNKEIDRACFYKKLHENLFNYDIVILADYGHGLIDRTAMEIIQDRAKFLALNCQTNSSNYGTNLITKYCRADTFTLDQRELSLAYGTNSDEYEAILPKLQNHLGSKIGWLTLGSLGAIAVYQGTDFTRAPALTLTVQDTVGAGDAFFSLSSICAKLGVSPEISTLFGNLSGALASSTLGNSKAVSKVDFLKFASTLLNF